MHRKEDKLPKFLRMIPRAKAKLERMAFKQKRAEGEIVSELVMKADK